MLYGKLLHVRAGRRKACKWPMVHGRDLPIEYYLTDAFGTINRMYWALGFWTDPVSDEDLENAKKFFEDAGGVRHGGTPEFTEIKEWIDMEWLLMDISSQIRVRVKTNL